MQFTETFTFIPPGKRVGETFKQGVNYRTVSAEAAAFAAAKGFTKDAAALAALESLGGKTEFLKADKAARKAADTRSAARQAAAVTSASGKGQDVSAAITAATAPLSELVETLRGEIETLKQDGILIADASQKTETDITDTIAAWNAAQPADETPVTTLAEIRDVLTEMATAPAPSGT